MVTRYSESLIRTNERMRIKERIEAIINDPNLLNIHSRLCSKNLGVSIEYYCDCDVAEFLKAVDK